MIVVVTNTFRVIIKHNAGGTTEYTHDDILEFNAEDGTWSKVGSMLLNRAQHAVSVINYLEIADYCESV